MKVRNVFDTREASAGKEGESFETLCSSDSVRVERIISRGHATPAGQWYEQADNEWVVLLKGRAGIEFSDGRQVDLGAGDFLLLPAGLKHRVSYTSQEPECVWLAVHFT